MIESQDLKELAEIVHHSMSEFQTAMRFRDDLTLKMAQRTTYLLRFGMIGLLLLAGTLFYLIITLTENMNNITLRVTEVAHSMEKIDKKLATVADGMQVVKQSMDQLGVQLGVMPTLNTTVATIGHEILNVRQDINHISTNMSFIRGSIGMMSNDIAGMNYQFTGVNNRLGMMGYDINKATAPIRFFPFSQQ
ncbi:MAG: hypothetical protein BWK79_07020 [Beggiatoa sp. IS2]|nr:MAG: hypothetical protein BWK79_07020 [Beggiatoa sp. IS2]